MLRDEIVTMTNEVFADEFEIDSDQLVPDANIFLDLGLDSLDMVDLVVALQKKFGVSARSDARIREVRTLNDLYDYILTVREEQGGDTSG